LASGLLVSACGGEGDTTSTEVSVEGNWSGTVAPAGATYSRAAFALIERNATALFYDEYGIVYRMPRLDGAYTFGGTVRAYAPIGYRFSSDAPDATYDIEGSAADSQITGALHNDSGTGQLTLGPFDTFKKTASVTDGQWMGYYITPTPYFVGLVVDAQGAVSGDDVLGCHLSGHIRQHSGGENLFDVTIASTGPRPVCGTEFKGMAHETDYDTFGYFKQEPGTYYYMVVIGGSSAFAAEFKVQ